MASYAGYHGTGFPVSRQPSALLFDATQEDGRCAIPKPPPFRYDENIRNAATEAALEQLRNARPRPPRGSDNLVYGVNYK